MALGKKIEDSSKSKDNAEDAEKDQIAADKLMNECKETLLELPVEHLVSLMELCRILYEVSLHSEENMMHADNLALVFGPTILITQSDDPLTMLSDNPGKIAICKYLINHSNAIHHDFQSPPEKNKIEDLWNKIDNDLTQQEETLQPNQRIDRLSKRLNTFKSQVAQLQSSLQDKDKIIRNFQFVNEVYRCSSAYNQSRKLSQASIDLVASLKALNAFDPLDPSLLFALLDSLLALHQVTPFFPFSFPLLCLFLLPPFPLPSSLSLSPFPFPSPFFTLPSLPSSYPLCLPFSFSRSLFSLQTPSRASLPWPFVVLEVPPSKFASCFPFSPFQLNRGKLLFYLAPFPFVFPSPSFQKFLWCPIVLGYFY